MEIQDVYLILNGEKKVNEYTKTMLKRYRDVYYGMSLHVAGACPKYYPLGNRQSYTEPPNYFGEEYQKIFTDRLLCRHPREQEETFQWRLSQYRPITKTPFLQIIELVSSAIFQDSNYSIEISDKMDSDYIWGNNFDGYDLMGWFANIGLQSIMEDPNGIIVRIPSKPYYEQDSQKVEVDVWFVKSKDIIYKSEEEIIFKKDEYAYYIDDSSIWRFTKVDAGYIVMPEDREGYYAHLFDKLPSSVAGGIWNTHGFFDSFLVKAVAVADEFVSSFSAEQMVDKEASHPFIVMGQSDCAYCDGTGKETIDCDNCDGGMEQVPCHVCDGKGIISNNPGERKLVPIEEMKLDHIKIVNPDTSINAYHHNKNNDVYELILDALNLWKTDQAQSGNAKAIDQERLYLFVSKIANHLFDKLIFDTITDIIAYRNAISTDGVVSPATYDFQIIKPTQYQIKTSADLLEDYSNGVKSGLPIFIRSKMSKDYIDKQYSGDRLMKKKAEIISEIDVTYCYSEAEKQTLLLTGSIQRYDLQKSVQLPSIIENIIRDKGEEWFLNASLTAIDDAVNIIFAPVNKLQIAINNKGDNGLSIEDAKFY